MEPKAIFDLLAAHLGAEATEYRENDIEPWACVSVSRIVELPARLSEEDWDHLVVRLREWPDQ